ncbi:hypothetical protein GCM10023088_16520 [Actinomadura verrucosospora]
MLAAIIFVATTGRRWQQLPSVFGPSGPTAHRRFTEWTTARVWAKLHGDKGHDHADLRRWLRRRGITPRIARRGIESSDRLGRYRWVVERTVLAEWLPLTAPPLRT